LRSRKLLAVDFGFGEQNLPFVAFFFHLVLFLFALVRFEANFSFFAWRLLIGDRSGLYERRAHEWFDSAGKGRAAFHR
jgi:hypothetical protein